MFASRWAAPILISLFCGAAANAQALSLAPKPVLSHFGVRAGDVQNLRLPTARIPDVIHVWLGGQPAVLEIDPNDVRTNGFQILVDDGRRLTLASTPESVTWRGQVRGFANSRVAASIFDGGLRAIVSLGSGSDAFEIQPVPAAMSTSAAEHLVFRAADIVTRSVRCDVGRALKRRNQLQLAQLQAASGAQPAVRLITMAIDTDYELYQHFGSSMTQVANEVATILNGVAAIYNSELLLDVFMSTLVVRTAPVYSGLDTGTLLTQLRAEWLANMSSVERDLCHMFSGIPVPASAVVGSAYLGGLCNTQFPTFGYGADIVTFGTLSEHVGLVSHELGHNSGADHCDGGANCAIMCSAIGGCGGGVTQFNPQSTIEIESHLLANSCLPIRGAEDCATAVPLTVGVSDRYTDRVATVSSVPVNCNSTSRDTWFRYTRAVPGPVQVSAVPESAVAASIEVYRGSCGTLVYLGCANAGFMAPAEFLLDESGIPLGVDYFVRVKTSGTPGGGVFRMNVLEEAAIAEPYGDSCSRSAAFYDEGPNVAGLANSSLHLTPNAEGGYDVSRQPFAWRPVPFTQPFYSRFAPPFSLFLGAEILLPFAFTHPGGTTQRLYVSSVPGELNLDRFPTVPSTLSAFLSRARLSPAWGLATSDLYTIHYEPVGSEVFVTWTMQFGAFQCVLRADGSVDYRYELGMGSSTANTIIGYSDGDGSVSIPEVSLQSGPPLSTSRRDPVTTSPLNRPVLGTVYTQRTEGIPADAVLAVFAIGFQQFSPGLDLGVLGAPGCQLLTSTDVTLPMSLATSPIAESTLGIVNDSGILGLNLFTQVLIVDPGFNALGIASSNGVALEVNSN